MSKEITIVGLTVEELEPKVQAKVLDKYREQGWNEIDVQELSNEFKYILLEDGLAVDNVLWSLSNCQGDGVAFKAKNLDLNILKTNPDFTKWIERFEELELDMNVEIFQSGRYTHYKTMTVNCHCAATRSSGNILVTEEVEDEITQFQRDLTDFIRKESLKLETVGYEYIDSYSSDRHISNYLIANEMYFTASGQLIPRE